MNVQACAKTNKTPMRWITRERPKIDRVACPWLIARFIDPEAEFIFVSPTEVIEKAKELDAVPYDVHGVELTHDGELCSFDAFLKKYNLDEPELRYLALIVRGADTDRHDLTPESGGLFAISLGLSDLHPGDDQAVLRDGFIVYDALYRWLKICRGEKHLWFPPASKLTTAG
jgi:hypothetical protein